MKSSLIKSTVIFLGLFFLYFPILVLIFYSFNENKRVMVWKGFSLRWYNELFNNEQIIAVSYTHLTLPTNREV